MELKSTLKEKKISFHPQKSKYNTTHEDNQRYKLKITFECFTYLPTTSQTPNKMQLRKCLKY